MDNRRKAGRRGATALPKIENMIERHQKRIRTRRNANALLTKLVMVAIFGYAMLTYVFGIGVVSGEGMYPRLRDGDLVVYYRLEGERNVGDVIAFTIDGEERYGRIVAMDGDTVDMNEDGQLLVNDSIQQEEIFFETLKEDRETEFPVTLAEDEVFILGDYRLYSTDSRDFGPVNIRQIDGKVISLLRRRGL